VTTTTSRFFGLPAEWAAMCPSTPCAKCAICLALLHRPCVAIWRQRHAAEVKVCEMERTTAAMGKLEPLISCSP
jgi:hypothetical protein